MRCRLGRINHIGWLSVLISVVFFTDGSATQTGRSASVDSSSVPVTVVDDLEGFIAIRSWLVAGPFASPPASRRGPGMSNREGFNRDYLTAIGGEQFARPREGTVIPSSYGNRVSFMTRTWNTDYVDLTEIFGHSSNLCAYLYAEVESAESRELFLHVGSNDAAKLWVNGRLTISDPTDHSARRSQHVVRVRLMEGRNWILMKVDQAGANWGAYVEFATAERRQIPDNYRAILLQRNLAEYRDDPFLYAISSSMSGLASVAAAYSWLFLVIVLIFIWAIVLTILMYRRKRAQERELYELRLAAIQNGLDPRSVTFPDEVRLAAIRGAGGGRSRTFVVWGLLLALGGFGLTVTEIAGSGFRNAGLEMAIMLIGVGLIIGSEYMRRTSIVQDDTPDGESEDFAERDTRLDG